MAIIELQYSTVQYITVQYNTVQYSTIQYSTVQYSTVQYSTVQYSTVQYSSVLYSTVQHSTAQYRRTDLVGPSVMIFTPRKPLPGLSLKKKAVTFMKKNVNSNSALYYNVYYKL